MDRVGTAHHRCANHKNRVRLRARLTMAKQSLVKEFFLFIKQEKKWWLVPFIVVLLLVGSLIVFASHSPLAPFIYPLF